MYPKIAIVTPLKNEFENIPKLLEAVSAQTFPIFCWVIVENGSTDGSRECLEKISMVENVENFIVANFTLPNDKYELGVKYASVVNHGFERITNDPISNGLDYIGILDADVFPEKEYYQKLTEFMKKDEMLGISSGVNFLFDGTREPTGSTWVRGNCRLWKMSCFIQCGYVIGPSADALSACKAITNGWSVYPNQDARCIARNVSAKVNPQYYGRSAYFRGVGPVYVLLSSVKYLLLGRRRHVWGFLFGYFGDFFKGVERTTDPVIKDYFRRSLVRKMVDSSKRFGRVERD